MTDATTYTTGSRPKTGPEKNSFTQDAERKVSAFAEEASGTASAALEKGKQLVEVASDQAKEAGQILSTRIKENPLSSVGVAFGVGILFALLRK